MNSIAQIIPQTRRVAVELAAELYDLKTTPWRSTETVGDAQAPEPPVC